MITTHQEHEVPLFPFTTGPGVTTWRAVTLHLGTPYFLAQYALRHGRGWLSQTTVYWRFGDLLEFCREIDNDKKRKTLGVFMLVPPPHENLSHGWEFVPIEEILIRRLEDEEDVEDDLPIFVKVGGKIYNGLGLASAENDTSDNALKKFERVFKLDKNFI